MIQLYQYLLPSFPEDITLLLPEKPYRLRSAQCRRLSVVCPLGVCEGQPTMTAQGVMRRTPGNFTQLLVIA